MKYLLTVFAVIVLSVSCQKQARDILRPEPISERPANFYPKPDNIPTHKPNEVVVIFKPGASKKILTGKGYTKAKTFSSEGEFYNVNVPDEHKALKEFQNDPNVEWAGLNTTHVTQDIFVPNDPSYPSQWNLSRIEAPAVWNSGNTGSKDVYVVVLDEGSLYWGCDLNSKLAVNEAEINGIPNFDDDNNGYPDDGRWWNWFDNSNEIYTGRNGHGTWCESIIGAESGNNLRIASLAPNVKIISLKFLAGFGYDSEAAKAIRYAKWIKETKGYNIVAISNSWGGGGYSQVLKDAIHEAGLAGINVVCAAGNSNQNTIVNPMLPAAYDEDCIISVGASTQDNTRAFFSNHSGADTTDYRAVDIYAPGVNNNALYPINHQEGEAELSGTSMSAPLVAGSIALLASRHPELTAAQRKAIILNTAKRVSTIPGTRGILNLNNPVYFGNVESVVPDFTCGVAPVLDLTPPTTMTLVRDSVVENPVTGYARIYLHWNKPTDNNHINGLDFQMTPFWGWWLDGPDWTSFEFDVPMDRVYDIKGRAVDSWGNPAIWSNIIHIDFTGTPPPSDNINPTTPESLFADQVDSTSFRLNWTPSTDQGGSGLKDYKIIWKKRGNTSWAMTFDLSSPYVVNAFVDPRSTYDVGVIARDGADNLSDTVFTVVTTPGGSEPPPPPPVTCSITSTLDANSNGLNVQVSWTENIVGTCTVLSRRVERKSKIKGVVTDWEVRSFNPSNPYNEVVPDAGQYWYRVIIQSSTGQTFMSNEKQIQVKRK